MRADADGRIRKALRSAALAEVQAIAIYDAECFWIRDPRRRAILERIRAEEVAHSGFISGWVRLQAWERVTNQAVGRVLGTLLACLPWKILCRVQGWAEAQASAIYLQTLREVEGSAQAERWPDLLEGLRDAARSEGEHAAEFRALAMRS